MIKKSSETSFFVQTYPDEELMDCTVEKLGHVLKKVLREGTGSAVVETGQEIVINYICCLEDGTLIDSSYARKRPLNVVLGNEEILNRVEIALQTMKINEKAFFKIEPDNNHYAIGKTNFPSDKKLFFEVEMIECKPLDLSVNLDKKCLKTILEKGEESYVKPKSLTQVTVNLVGSLLDNCVFDNRELTFSIHETDIENDVCLGVQLCILSMKKGEKAKVIIHRSYAFDKIPTRFKNLIPDDYDQICYEIKLISFEIKKEIWEMCLEERFEEALKLKTKGKDFFKQCKYEAAAKQYEGIINYVGPDKEHDFKEKNEEKNDLLKLAYLNLAQANLSMNKDFEAIKAAEFAINLDPNNIKGYYRRAMGYFKINDYEKAMKDFEQILIMEPNNTVAKNQKQLCIDELKKLHQKEKNIFKGMFDKKMIKDEEENQKTFDVFEKVESVEPTISLFQKSLEKKV